MRRESRQRDTDQHEGGADEHPVGKGLSEHQGSDAHSDDWNPEGDEGQPRHRKAIQKPEIEKEGHSGAGDRKIEQRPYRGGIERESPALLEYRRHPAHDHRGGSHRWSCQG